MPVLDSSAVIEILYGTPRGRAVLDLIGEKAVAETAFTVYEVFEGLREREREKANEFFGSMEVLSFDAEVVLEREKIVALDKDFTRVKEL